MSPETAVEARVTRLEVNDRVRDEQINGREGIYKRLDDLTTEVKGLRRAIQGMNVAIVLAAVTFALGIAGGHL